MPGKNLELANNFANEYDNSVVRNNWLGPQFLFELLQPLLQPKSNILDLGIGTGESSILFNKSGHIITGLDGSQNMLEQCKKKITEIKLVLHDLENCPLPFSNTSFDAIISNGVFHLTNPLSPIITEAARILKPQGYFVFTYENTDDTVNYSEIEPGIWEFETQTGVLTYKHSNSYIEKQLVSNQFKLINRQQFLAFQNTELQKDFYFTAVLAELQPNQQH